MSTVLSLSCRCGAMGGELRDVSPRHGSRVVCYCRDCRAFARHLGQGDTVLDPHGGTEIYQTTSDRLSLADPGGKLACLRLRTGGLLRWYVSCCNTPIGNTLGTPGLPFIGLITGGLPAAAAPVEDFGPVMARAFVREAEGGADALAADAGSPFRLVALAMARSLWARATGGHRRTPLFDAASRAPVVEPRVLTDGELQAAMGAAGPAAAESPGGSP
ncbi:MAG: DUF6151 family protein [Pseudomonadota bacterium]